MSNINSKLNNIEIVASSLTDKKQQTDYKIKYVSAYVNQWAIINSERDEVSDITVMSNNDSFDNALREYNYVPQLTITQVGVNEDILSVISKGGLAYGKTAASLIVSLYDSNCIFSGVQIKMVTVAQGKSQYDIPLDTDEYSSLRIFIWNKDTLAPLISETKLEIADNTDGNLY